MVAYSVLRVCSDSNYDKWIMIDHIPHSDAGLPLVVVVVYCCVFVPI